MRLSSKILVGAAVVITTVNIVVFYLVGRCYDRLLVDSLTENARNFYKQIVVTRAWVARHGGVYLKKQPGVEVNPFLPKPVLTTAAGDSLVLRNPALVTRELSDLSESMGERFKFHLTSLKPLNPQNIPNDFEKEALLAIQGGDQNHLSPYGEFTKVEVVKGKRYFRYFAPLYTEESCISCHGKQGYRVGDVRGGISIIIPTEQVDRARQQNYFFIILGCFFASVIISMLIYSVLRKAVILPLRRLELAAEEIGKGNYASKIPVQSKDEIGDLGRALGRMQREIRRSTNRLVENEKMVALGQLSAGIAHEIRNPLFAIHNNLDYLKRNCTDNGNQLEIYREMEDGLARINRIVKAVLGYSKPHQPEFGRHSIRDVIDRCIALMGKQLEQEKIELSLDIEAGLPEIEMDIHKIEQVFVNLLTNARQAIHEAGGKIWIGVKRRNADIEISIRDTGHGIKKNDLRKIFNPFFTRLPNGTGLGLTIVHRIIEQHGGSIRVQSRIDEGTTFTVRLPIHQGN